MQSDRTVNGIDVSKDELWIAVLGDKSVRCVSNTAQEIRSWLAQVPKDSIVAMESTGRYHQLLAQLAAAAGMRVYVLNAHDVRLYARGLGSRGKTDRLDAQVIARYVSEHHDKLHQWQPALGDLGRIDELLRRRAVIVTKREALRQCLRGCEDLRSAATELDRAFAAVVRAIERKVKQLVSADDKLRDAQRRLATVVGFGPVGSTLLAVLLQHIPFANADALVAYSGWDPRANDSGSKQGRRRLTKRGPAHLRKQWYMAGMTAARTTTLKPLYQALLARGLAATEAFVILGRKLLRAAYAVWKTARPFDLETFLQRPQSA